MSIDGLGILIAATICTLGYAAWLFARDARRAQRRVRFLTDLLEEKNTRLYAALDERDRAIAHAEDAQQLVGAMARHPVLTLVDGGAS